MTNGKGLTLSAYLYNNSRRLHGMPMRRKGYFNTRRKKYIRNQPNETLNAYIDWTNE